MVESGGFNPLGLILLYLEPISGSYLTREILEHIDSYLRLGGIICESTDETLDCLLTLEEIGLVKLLEDKTDNNTYYKVYTTYGK